MKKELSILFLWLLWSYNYFKIVQTCNSSILKAEAGGLQTCSSKLAWAFVMSISLSVLYGITVFLHTHLFLKSKVNWIFGSVVSILNSITLNSITIMKLLKAWSPTVKTLKMLTNGARREWRQSIKKDMLLEFHVDKSYGCVKKRKKV